MDKINCPSWEGCAAPLCPLEPLTGAQWFPDEDICNTLAYRQTHWIKIQRKIKRLHLKSLIEHDHCFTLPALQAMKKVRHPKGMLPEDLYKNGRDRTSTMG
ncbi:MAG: hypothetical protein ABSB31_04810 [Dehalococcoidia bacterium]|jgi:hypothetical protein